MRTASGSRDGRGRGCGPDGSGGLEAEVGMRFISSAWCVSSKEDGALLLSLGIGLALAATHCAYIIQ